MPIADRRATLSERRYLAARLQADGINVQFDPREVFDIPLVISDLEIMEVYNKADARTAEFIADHGRPLYIAPPTVPQPGARRRGIPLALVTPLVFVFAFVCGAIVAWGVR